MKKNFYFKKKPIVVKAFDFSKTMYDENGNPLVDGIDIVKNQYFINTLEGQMFIQKDDFIIIGIKGEKYPIKRDIFFETYESIE